MARTTLRTVFALALAATALPAQDRLDFQSQVWPVISKHCTRCHGSSRQKGGLRLDGKKYIVRGTLNGPVLVPGKPEQSLLYSLTALSEDDPDIMPAKGDPVPKDEQKILHRWISEGADFGSWLGEGAPKEGCAESRSRRRKRVPSLIEKLAVDVAPLAPALIKSAAGDLATIKPVLPQSPLLRVTFGGHQARVNDKAVRLLASIASHIVDLDLGGTRITNKALATVRHMKRLTRLDLHDTDIDGRSLKHLAALLNLRSLNLYGTDVGDKGLTSLHGLSHLERLYLWQSKATAEGVKTLRRALLRVKVILEQDLPTPAPPAENNRRRRRRG